MSNTTLEMAGITIEFPGVKALDSVNFTMESGTAHALIGANGAGKSTLMKVLSGSYHQYSGKILMNGKEIKIRSPKDAQVNGIQIVHQEVDTALIPYLTVGENIMLSKTVHHLGKRQFISWKNLHKEASAVLESLNINVPSKKLISDLTLAEKQMVLIARTVSTECKFLILDEPTAPLSHSETTELYRIVAELKTKGVGIIFISHRLPEIFRMCDEITILRNGKVVARERINETSAEKVVEQMLGRELSEQFPVKSSGVGECIFEVQGLNDADKLKNVSFKVHQGEIVGLAGLVGAGKTELCKVLFGERKKSSGRIKLRGQILHMRNPHNAVKLGVVLVPEERRKEGILVMEPVSANLSVASLGSFTKAFGFLDRKAEMKTANDLINRLGIKTPSPYATVKNLSGGNQQKIAIGKWLIVDADVYIFDEPTKGVDVGAKKDIFELICELAERGKAIIYASSELSEIIGITHRSYVLYDGKIVQEFQTSKTNEEELLYFSTGGK